MNASEELSVLARAEDILLGAMGFSEDAKLSQVVMLGDELILEGIFNSDGENFSTEFDCERGPLEEWALEVLKADGRVVVR